MSEVIVPLVILAIVEWSRKCSLLIIISPIFIQMFSYYYKSLMDHVCLPRVLLASLVLLAELDLPAPL